MGEADSSRLGMTRGGLGDGGSGYTIKIGEVAKTSPDFRYCRPACFSRAGTLASQPRAIMCRPWQ